MCPWVHVAEQERFRERALDGRGEEEGGRGVRINMDITQDVRQEQDIAQRIWVWSQL